MVDKVILNDHVKAIVGVKHLGEADLPENTKKTIQHIADKYGAWYEGDGKDKGALGVKYKGSWDDEFAKTVKGYPEEFLYGIFTNIDVNKQADHFLDPKVSILDSIIKHQKGARYFKDREFTKDQLIKFLRQGSERDADLVEMADVPATIENLNKFLKTGEKLMWPPGDWMNYPNRLGKMAKKAEDARNQFVKDADKGVYVVGYDHIKEIRKGRAHGGLIQDKYPTRYLPNVGRQVMQEGGVPTTDDSIVGSVEFAPEPVLPTFAQPETQAVTKALDVANAAPPKEYKPFGVLPFREDESGIHFDPHAGVLGSVISGFTAPYDVATGKLDPMSDEGVKRALDVAGLAMSGSAFGTRPAGALASGPSRPGIGHNMPPEEMRVTNEIGMYSHAADVARGLPQQSGTIEQMLAMVKKAPGVSPEEIHWSGIEKAFQPGQKVTAEDVAQHFEQNLPKVTETMYGGKKVAKPHISNPDEWTDYFEGNRDGWAGQYDKDSFEELTPAQQRRVERELKEEFDGDFMDPDYGYVANPVPGYNKPAKFEWLSRDGGKNYREITLQLDPPQGEFKGSHHDEPNTVGHLRVSDFKGPNNEKILYVHEVQSDWGQKGRKAGFNPESMPAAPYVANREGAHNTPGWTDLLVKRIMQEAQRGGYDKVVFETVDEQIKRSGTSSAKGMNAFYGDILPKRIAKVMKHADPNFSMTSHEIGQSQQLKPIEFDKYNVRDALSEMDQKAIALPEGQWLAPELRDDVDPSLTYLGKYFAKADQATDPASQLKLAGLHDDYVLHQGSKQGVEPPRTTMSKMGNVFTVVDEELGEQVGSFATRKEALAAMKTYNADKVMEKIKSGSMSHKRLGFDVTKAVKHVGKNTRAYKYGGDVEDALDIARKVGR